MSLIRVAAVCLTVLLSLPGLARATAATCDDFDSCFANQPPCGDDDLLIGIAVGAVDGIADLLCFVGDPKCACFQAITGESGPEADEWSQALEAVIQQCGGTASGSRSLSGVAFEAANQVCTPTFAADVEPILNGTCGVCHISGSSGGFNFAGGIGDLVNQASNQSDLVYVAPGDPAGSYLLHKIEGTQVSVGGSGGRMPQGGMLPTADITTIKAWIVGGALP